MEEKNISKYYASTYQTPDYHGLGFACSDQPLQVNSCGYYDGVVPSFTVRRPQGRRDYSFSYQHSGRSYVDCGSKVYTMHPGDILLYAPEMPQIYWYNKTDYVRNFWVHFTGSQAAALLKELGIPCGIPHSMGCVPEIGEMITKVVVELNEKRPAYRMYSAALFLQMTALATRRICQQGVGYRETRNTNIYKSLEYIHNHYHTPLRVQDLAAHTYLSLNRYTNVFRDLVGVTPQKYIINLRLQKAIELLQITDWDIQRIAQAVGYEDPLYFSRIFKQYIGLSPSKYLLEQQRAHVQEV